MYKKISNNDDWKSPIYEYEIGKKKINIKIDVTSSIPSFRSHIRVLEDLIEIFKNENVKSIIDFGAGRLRNSLFLLNQGYTIYSVEFEKALTTPMGKEMYQLAKTFEDNFFFLKYPHDFLDSKIQADAVIIINVINIIPDLKHRVLVINECAKRLKSTGLMLVMTHHNEPHYQPNSTKRRRLNDGYVYKLNKTYKSFNKEFSYRDLKSLPPESIFNFERDIVHPKHHSMLFRKK